MGPGKMGLLHRELALTLSSVANAPYKQIRSIWMESSFGSKSELISLLSRSNSAFTSAKPREKRLRKLKELAERKEYQKLVKDITLKKF
ncbi:Thymic stromal cotransporter [Gossypium australe]|uniref:Thymic stromal cotransporter n=1 Tax=Gossypium australe TaxID=47621 RepID=A0A5B6VQP5_9ROSI|nr:Thymic stromal cotransporter [Gossypium australe]